VILELAQLIADSSPVGADSFPWVGAVLTPTAAAGVFYKMWHDERADRLAMTKLMLDEVVPLLTRNVDVLKSIDEKLEPPTVRLRGDRA
jgi:hypothetical protein